MLNAMRIALIIAHFSAEVGGAEGFAVEVARRLAVRGHDVHVVAEDGGRLPGITFHQCSLNRASEFVDAHVRPEIRVDWGLNIPADVHRLGGGTHKEFLRYNMLGRSTLGCIAKRIEQAISSKHRRAIRKEALLLRDPEARFVAVSEFVKNQLQRTAPIPDERIKVLHNGVNRHHYNSEVVTKLRGTARTDLGLGVDDVVFLFVGHNLRLKNIALLEAVFGRLARVCPNARLLVVGKRCPRVQAHWLLWSGAVRDPAGCYAAADALLHPTFYDACANVVLEALACGLPVVSSDFNGSAELITDGMNGFVRPVVGKTEEVVSSWCTIVHQLAEDRALRERVGGEALRLAAAHGMDKYVDAFEAYLAEVCSEKSAV